MPEMHLHKTFPGLNPPPWAHWAEMEKHFLLVGTRSTSGVWV